MAFKIEERLEVKEPVERVLQYLIDPKRVVQCLPGAELLELKDDGSFRNTAAAFEKLYPFMVFLRQAIA